ncbi:uncharacterized protein LOC120082446 isoform X1 [Benincasa hispida]|uniref:uncharacterized protein LOC120082446 isoform X1 n=1 Tax=Benincasa hispida TaxID=102211 RepID=UPI0019013109|nr:uncharacterized protein LOC120082446 isoform X1 [Benincasa hispida]
MENGRRPGRSDARLSMEEEREMEAKTREYFNSVAPKRHTKPQRSEFSAHYVDKVNGKNDYIPELAEFQRLESDPHERLTYDARNGKISEEFVETKYYDDLNCADKQHHTTGTGFIKMENGDCKGFRLSADSATAGCCHGSCRGNPANNDWIPATNDLVFENMQTRKASQDKPKLMQSSL